MERFFTDVKEPNVHHRPRGDADLLRTVMESVRRLLVSRKDYDATSELMYCGSVSQQ